MRERTGFMVAAALITLLVPLWSVFDYWLEPANAPVFLAIRIAVASLGAAAWVVVRRSTRANVNRIAIAAAALATGIAIAYFIACLAGHYYLYSIGFSVVFWTFGSLLVWPWGFTVVVYAAILGVHVALELGSSAAPDSTAFVGMLAYLATAAVISIAISFARRRLEYQAFVATYELEAGNRELAATLDTLRATQARLVAHEKLSALGRLVAQLSHEINNPVNVIQNNLEPIATYATSLDEVLDLAQRTCADSSGELARRWRELDIDFVRRDIRDAIGTMAVAAERIRDIQRDLRAFMRGDATPAAELDLNAGVRESVAAVMHTAGPGCVLIERYGALPPARFNPGQLGEVTANLVQNAVDAIGGAGRIDVETRVDGDHLVLSVADSGPGLCALAKRHLFEPFFTTKPVGKGAGLGLAACYQIVRAHGGTIALDDRHAPGARFVVTLPLMPPDALARASAALASATGAATMTRPGPDSSTG